MEWLVDTGKMRITVEGKDIQSAVTEWSKDKDLGQIAKSVNISQPLIRVQHKGVWRWWSNKIFLKCVGVLDEKIKLERENSR